MATGTLLENLADIEEPDDESVDDRPPMPEGVYPNGEPRRYEFIDGEWVERKIMGAKAGQIVFRLGLRLGNYNETRKLGTFFTSDAGYKVFPHDPKLARFPDLSFLRHGRLPDEEPPDGLMNLVPDFMVEVVSPRDTAEEVETRIMDFVRVRVPLIWIVYPKARCVRVIRAGGAASQLGETDELRGEDVLPGFSCKIEELFAEA
jgi:Uma2 family endonuclease